jgi:hypothetical protein
MLFKASAKKVEAKKTTKAQRDAYLQRIYKVRPECPKVRPFA